MHWKGYSTHAFVMTNIHVCGVGVRKGGPGGGGGGGARIVSNMSITVSLFQGCSFVCN